MAALSPTCTKYIAYVLPLISELFNTCVCINCCFNGNEVGHYIAQARRFTVAKQYQSSFYNV